MVEQPTILSVIGRGQPLSALSQPPTLYTVYISTVRIYMCKKKTITQFYIPQFAVDMTKSRYNLISLDFLTSVGTKQVLSRLIIHGSKVAKCYQHLPFATGLWVR